MIHRLYIPENLNLITQLSSIRDEKWIKKNKYRYFFILSSIHYRRVTNKSYGKNSYIPLHYKQLRTIVSQRLAKTFIDDLIKVGVIECDNHHIQGVKSRGYRFTAAYRDVKTRAFENIDDHLISRMKKHIEDVDTYALSLEPHIKRIYQCMKSIHLDTNEANKVLRNKYENQTEALAHSKIALDLIEDKFWFFTRDNFGGRIHSNLTTLPKVVRPYIIARHTFTNQKIDLTELDIKNSQPMFFLAYMKTQNEWDIPQFEIHQYAKLLKKGFYEFFMNELGNFNREAVKTNVFKKLFYNKSYPLKLTKYEKVFKTHFPIMFKVITKIKQEKHNQLALKLQKLEADLIINIIAKEYVKKHPLDFITTIHDSILINKFHATNFQSIIKSKILKMYGVDAEIHLRNLH